MKTLSQMVGEEIIASIPSMHQTVLQQPKLLAVEHSALWVESDKLTQTMLTALKVQAAPKTAIFFIPFHEIRFIMASADYPSLREGAF